MGRGTYGRVGPLGARGTPSRGAWGVREGGAPGDQGDPLPWGVGLTGGGPLEGGTFDMASNSFEVTMFHSNLPPLRLLQ